ncbi:MAG: T9SS type A sorting domain-containing protein [Bacteroidales bacterium]|nr:T9SS type A sorting domain-containing protein [Bacteroidales bacterium]
MKNLYILLILVVMSVRLMGQGCLPEGITFTTQAQIDSFAVNYPGCTEIEGSVYVMNGQVQNLQGLINITLIDGGLYIFGQDDLTSLSGLDNLISIGETLEIDNNSNLVNFMGLQSLTTVGSDMIVVGNYVLENFEGLNSLSNVGGRLDIAWNNILLNFSGLENLNTVGVELYIFSNHSLSNLTGLENLSNAGGVVQILYNSNLNSIQALSGIAPGSINQMDIYGNLILNECNIPAFCDYLMDPTGVVNIYQNDDGCNNPSEVAESCGFELDCLPYGNYWVATQQEADNFFQNYPGCTDLKGNLHIGGQTLNYVNGLSGINSVEGDLLIQHNYSMNNLIGLESLTSVGGDLNIGGFEEWNYYLRNMVGLENLVNFDGNIQIIGNESLENLHGLNGIDTVNDLTISCYPSMIDLSGLDSLTSVMHDFHITGNSLKHLYGLEKIDSVHGNLSIGGSDSLIDLEGLNSLNYIGGELRISYNKSLNNLTNLISVKSVGDIAIMNNESLTSLSGLDSINGQGISYMYINDNEMLSHCEVVSVCEYLIGINGTAVISNNALGCENRETIEAACTVGQKEIKHNDICTVFPNPSSGRVSFSITLTEPSPVKLVIMNGLGQQIVSLADETLPSGSNILFWNAGQLPDGIYYYKLQTDNQTVGGKIVLMK